MGAKGSTEITLTEPVHFIGIGGVGMSALAELAHKKGLSVQGSDVAENSYVRALKDLGIPVFMGHDAKHLGQAKTIVFGSAIPESNVERAAARDQNLPLIHRSQCLAALMQGSMPITVSGTHGKTTTTAMIAHMLCELGLDPSVAVGGRMTRFQSPAHLGKGTYFVAEADESDGSFLNYDPFLSVLTNIDADHLDFYKTHEAMQKSFAAYLERTDKDGAAIIGWDQHICRDLGHKFSGDKLTYGSVIGSDIRALDYKTEEGITHFRAVVERDVLTCEIPLLGKHNVQNALCCLAVARALDLDVKKAAVSLSTFEGVSRRMSLVYRDEHVSVFDDYAHNPGKISACVQAAKESWPKRALHVVYQPHRYSRLETMYEETMAAFTAADHVYVLPVYAAFETTDQDFSPTRLAGEITKFSKVPTTACQTFEDTLKSLKPNLGDQKAIVLTVGAGDVWKVAQGFKEMMA